MRADYRILLLSVSCFILLFIGSCSKTHASIDWIPFSPHAVKENSSVPTIVYFFASWCEPCRAMQATTFSQPEVIDAVKDYQLLKVDFTESGFDDAKLTQAQKEIITTYDILGLPTIVFLSKQAKEDPSLRATGYVGPADFLSRIDKLAAPQQVGTQTITTKKQTTIAKNAWGAWPTRLFRLPLNNPPVVGIEDASHMKDDDVVAGIVVRDQARAYPWWAIHTYHVVNDIFKFGKRDYEAISLSLCDRCSGVATMKARFNDGKRERLPVFYVCEGKFDTWGTFATCDYNTQSKWHPFIGECVEGPLKGVKLERITTHYMRWQDWKANYPHTTVVLSDPTVRDRDHNPDREMVPGEKARFGRNKDNRLTAYELVFGLTELNTGHAIALEHVKAEGGVYYTTANKRRIVALVGREFDIYVFYANLDNVTLDAIRKVSDVPLRFTDATGTLWNGQGLALSGPLKDEQLTPVPGYVTEWFEYSRYHSGGNKGRVNLN